ncbi:MAG: DUF5723 family protein [Draconibacterium sp.]
MIKWKAVNIFRLILLFAVLFAGKSSLAQISGSLFMNTTNFYAQINNPSYFRTDKATAFSVAGFAGLSFVNQGNFKISEAITLDNAGNPVIDFIHFYENSKEENIIRQDVAVPVLYAGLPLNDGYFHFYYNENMTAISGIRKEALAFLSNGNLLAEYHNFNSEEIRLSGLGYREFAFGYAKPLNDLLHVGIRAKLLFGAAQADTRSWDYGVEASADGDSVTLIAGGTGQMMLPLPLNLRADNSILSVNTDGAFQKYMSTYQNPGFAIDLGFNYSKGDQHFFSAALRDLGAIWFRNQSFNVAQDESLVFAGFDLVGAIRYPEEGGYYNPGELVRIIKEDIRDVYQPVVAEAKYLYWMPVKSVLHYHYQYSSRHLFGVTSQMAFQRKNVRSVFTLSAQQKWLNFSVFENVNLQGINGVTLGGGFQYEGEYAQIFVATDNLVAIYHPAANKTFSLNFGICFLLNHKKEVNEKSIAPARGKASRYLPFYEQKNKRKSIKFKESLL